jgi:hypothetical protein
VLHIRIPNRQVVSGLPDTNKKLSGNNTLKGTKRGRLSRQNVAAFLMASVHASSCPAFGGRLFSHPPAPDSGTSNPEEGEAGFGFSVHRKAQSVLIAVAMQILPVINPANRTSPSPRNLGTGIPAD